MNENTIVNVDRDNLEVTMERTFNAPRELVFRAYTDPALIPEWWGPRNTTTEVIKMDFREGGTWRFVSREGEKEDAFNGEFREIVEPEYITWTFNYEPQGPGHETVETVKFEEMPGDPEIEGDMKTKVSTVSKFQNIDDLDGMVGSGMEQGAKESWDRLEELLDDLREELDEEDEI